VVRTAMLTLLITLGSAQSLFAKPASITLAELIDDSDRVVLAEVESVTWSYSIGGRYARARVLETWKGAPSAQVEYVASCSVRRDCSGRRSFPRNSSGPA
jgi:hypothetical protein